jgi:hypothetical protein
MGQATFLNFPLRHATLENVAGCCHLRRVHPGGLRVGVDAAVGVRAGPGPSFIDRAG